MVGDTNAIALAKRSTLPVFNNFPIEKLNAMPHYFGWVDCNSGHGKFKMLLGGDDDGVALRFFWNGCYEKATLEIWQKLANVCEFALDIGAHTGAYTLAAKSSNPQISVAAFEPHFMNFGRLNLNMRVNRSGTQNLFMKAVGDGTKTLPFTVPDTPDRLTTGGALGARTGQTTQIQVVALDAFLPQAIHHKVGLVKIDTEGHEAQCLKGMRAIIVTAKPIIFFECIGAASGLAVQEVLVPLGYSFLEVDDELETITPVAAVVPHFGPTGKVLQNRVNRIALPEGVRRQRLWDRIGVVS